MVEINNTTKQYIPIKKVKVLVEKFFAYHKEDNWNISIAIVNDRVIQKLNREYRQIDKVTDILSFNGEEAGGKRSGEIVIDIDEVRRIDNYKDVFAQKPTHKYLFSFVLIHGLLHLIGYNDETEEGRQEMLALGREFLSKNHL